MVFERSPENLAAGSYGPSTGTTSPWNIIDMTQLSGTPLTPGFKLSDLASSFGLHNGAIVSLPAVVKYKTITDGLDKTIAIVERRTDRSVSGSNRMTFLPSSFLTSIGKRTCRITLVGPI